MKNWALEVVTIFVAGMMLTGCFVGYVAYSKSKVLVVLTVMPAEE